MRGIVKSNAIVLKKKDLVGDSLVVTLLTESNGKLYVFGKGVKNITSRRLPNMQTGNYITAVMKSKNDLYYIQEVQLHSYFSGIKKSEKKLKQMYFFLFILEWILPENQREKQIYDFTISLLIKLSKQSINEGQLIQFCSHLLEILGYDSTLYTMSNTIDYIEGIINKKIPYFII